MDLSGCDVFVLAAGRGSRLRPLTDTLPKALVSVGGKPLIAWNLELLSRAGCKRVIVNLFHLGDQIRSFLGDGRSFGMEAIFVEEPHLLDTGGSIRNIELLLEHEQLFTINSDILVGPDFSPGELLERHLLNANKPLATMVVRADPAVEEYGALEIARDGRVVGFLGDRAPGFKEAAGAGVGAVTRRMFTGIQLLERAILDRMPPPGSVFSVTRDTERSLVVSGEPIFSVEYSGYWNDVGTPDRLEQASNEISRIYPVP